LFLTGLALAASLPAAAQQAIPVTPGAALALDAAEVARTLGGDPAAALTELRAQQASIAVTDWIEGRYRDRLAGIAVEPGGAVSVLLTGRAPVEDGEVTVGDLRVPIRFRTGAKATHTQLLDALTRHQAAIRAMVGRPPGMGLDARRGELVVLISNADARGDIAGLRRSIETLTGVPVRIAATTEPQLDLGGPERQTPVSAPQASATPPSTAIMGGSRVIGRHDPTGGRYICTSGFVVAKGDARAIVTAAHCPDPLTYSAPDGTVTPMPFVGQWGWGYHDVQVNSTTAPVAPRFYSDAARSVVRPVLTQRSRAQTRTGDIVCHRGERSGYSCAVVDMVDFAPSGDLCGGPCLPTWVAVKGPGCKGGDSGGPVFIGTTAIGLLKGGSYRADKSCAFYYYMSLDYLPDGWALLTEALPATP
jgi:hypothetical protein